MSQATRGGVTLPILVVCSVIVAGALWGSSTSIDSILPFVTRPDEFSRRACYEIKNKPARTSEVSWRVGSTEDKFTRRIKDMDRCTAAKSGDWASLLVVPQGNGSTKCRIWVEWEGGSTEIDRGSSINGGMCRANGLIP